MSRRVRLLACAVLVLALGLRVGYVVATPGYRLDGDAHAYDHLARGIAATGSYPEVDGRATAYRPPALPYLLGGIDALAGHSDPVTADRLLLAAVGTAAVALIALLARSLLGTTAGLATLGLAAIYPPWVTVGTSLLSEPLLVVLELGVLLCALRGRAAIARLDRPTAGPALGWALAAGALTGAAWLTRANGVVLLPALLVGLRPTRGPRVPDDSDRPRRRTRASGAALAPAAVAVLAVVVVVAPWSVRNATVFHRFIPVSDEAGGTLLGSYNAASARDRENPAGFRELAALPSEPALRRAMTARSEPAFQAGLLNDALSYVGRHPLYPLTVAGNNALRLLDLHGLAQTERTGPASGLASSTWAIVDAAGFWVLALLAVAGAASGAPRRLPGFVWIAAALLAISELLISVETPRFRLPLEPWVLVLAGAAVARAGITLRTRRRVGRGELETA